jgi:hypothetical protein
VCYSATAVFFSPGWELNTAVKKISGRGRDLCLHLRLREGEVGDWGGKAGGTRAPAEGDGYANSHHMQQAPPPRDDNSGRASKTLHSDGPPREQNVLHSTPNPSAVKLPPRLIIHPRGHETNAV